jgi:hypothetical protein
MRHNPALGITTVHDPGALGLAVLGFDFFEKTFQRGLISRVTRQYFIAQGKTFRCHDQGHDHLHTIRALVARVTKTAFIFGVLGWINLKIGAR